MTRCGGREEGGTCKTRVRGQLGSKSHTVPGIRLPCLPKDVFSRFALFILKARIIEKDIYSIRRLISHMASKPRTDASQSQEPRTPPWPFPRAARPKCSHRHSGLPAVQQDGCEAEWLRLKPVLHMKCGRPPTAANPCAMTPAPLEICGPV